MKVVHITNNDSIGGASRAAYRLHEAMTRAGISSTFFVFHQMKNDSTIISPFSFLDRIRISINIRLENLILRRYCITSTFSYAKFGFNISNKNILKNADAIYLHWINAGMLSINSIVQILKIGKPVYYFMHDMWPITGGCHHSFSCEKYKIHCGRCPLLNSNKEHDLSYKLLNKKINKLSVFENLYAITPSVWLRDCAKKSSLFNKKNILLIPNLLDTTIFSPLKKSTLRNKYNLPLNKKLILFAAISGIKNVYKGWSYLVESMNYLNPFECEILVLGTSSDERIAKELPLKSYFLGHLSSDIQLAEIYSIADVFVSPSLADNFPNTIVESMACGTPVVGFDVGGIPDLIKHKFNGYLSNFKSSEDLANGIKWILSQKDETLSQNARQYVINNLSYEKVIPYHFYLKDIK